MKWYSSLFSMATIVLSLMCTDCSNSSKDNSHTQTPPQEAMGRLNKNDIDGAISLLENYLPDHPLDGDAHTTQALAYLRKANISLQSFFPLAENFFIKAEGANNSSFIRVKKILFQVLQTNDNSLSQSIFSLFRKLNFSGTRSKPSDDQSLTDPRIQGVRSRFRARSPPPPDSSALSLSGYPPPPQLPTRAVLLKHNLMNGYYGVSQPLLICKFPLRYLARL